MKIISIEVHNIGPMENAIIAIDKPLTLLCGAIKQGKTTILNAVKWAFGGTFPDDIITHGHDEGFIHLTTDTGSIRREFVRKGDKIVAKKVQFIHNGQVLQRPSEELKRIVNPFVINTNYLADMDARKLHNFLIDTIGLDTSAIDSSIKELEKLASATRVEVKAYGDIDLNMEPVEVPDRAAIQAAKEHILNEWDQSREQVRLRNEEIEKHNFQIQTVTGEKNYQLSLIAQLEKQLEDARALVAKQDAWLAQNTPMEKEPEPERPDTRELDERLAEIATLEAQQKVYEKNRSLAEAKQNKIDALREVEAQLKAKRNERKQLLAQIADACPIPRLGFNENGDLVYENTSVDMLSTSQLMQLQSAVRALYKQTVDKDISLDLELVDRAESLGSSVYDYISYAKENELNVLAAVVSEEPANVPEEVGVFIVKDGKVT